MSNNDSLYERMGGTYREGKDGMLYPDIKFCDDESINVGKYGMLWIENLYDNRHLEHVHLLMDGSLWRRAAEINEEAYELKEASVKAYLAKHPAKDRYSTMEKWKLREQAEMMAEEIVMLEVVRRGNDGYKEMSEQNMQLKEITD